MNIGNVTNERSTWGTSAYSGQAATFGSGGVVGFEETLKNSVGFGSKSEGGQVVESISRADLGTMDLVSQLQFSLLKNDGSGGVGSRLNNALF